MNHNIQAPTLEGIFPSLRGIGLFGVGLIGFIGLRGLMGFAGLMSMRHVN